MAVYMHGGGTVRGCGCNVHRVALYSTAVWPYMSEVDMISTIPLYSAPRIFCLLSYYAVTMVTELLPAPYTTKAHRLDILQYIIELLIDAI